MKRHKAGSYSSRDISYYAVKMENGWWTVGRSTATGDNEQVEDFRTYREARRFIITKEAERNDSVIH